MRSREALTYGKVEARVVKVSQTVGDRWLVEEGLRRRGLAKRSPPVELADPEPEKPLEVAALPLLAAGQFAAAAEPTADHRLCGRRRAAVHFAVADRHRAAVEARLIVL